MSDDKVKSIESKIMLKNNLTGFDGKTIPNTSELPKFKAKFPKLSQAELVAKCPPFTIGEQLAGMLMQLAGSEETKEATEKLKLFRWASKIHDKMETDKGELSVDLVQITALFGYISKVKGMSIIVQGPLLVILEDMKESLTQNDLK